MLKERSKSMGNLENCCIFAEDKLHLGKECKGKQKIRNYGEDKQQTIASWHPVL